MMTGYRWVAGFVFCALSAAAAESQKSLKDGGTWVSDKAPKVKVKLEPAHQGVKQSLNQGVHVSMNKGGEQNPPSIGITFVDANGKKTYVELKAVDPFKFPTQYETSSATVNSRAQSFIGFELKIPFGSEKSTVLKSEDLRKEDEPDLEKR